MPSSDHLIWIDLEMTGLKPESDVIIEIATVVTDKNLNVIAEGPNLAIHQPDDVLARMDEWNQKQHGTSGLVARVKASTITTADAEARTLAFLSPLVNAGASPMCGNSICQDRRFLARLMPALEHFFHYRNLDVSTLKELARRWAPSVSETFVKTGAHLAHADIHESIRELRHYRATLFAPQSRSVGLRPGRSYARQQAATSFAAARLVQAPQRLFSPDLLAGRNSQVSTTVSGFRDMLSMPCSSSQRASSGWSEGPWPQMPMYLPCLRQAVMAMLSRALTASSRSSNSLATMAESRSRPRASCVMSFEPMDMPSKYSR